MEKLFWALYALCYDSIRRLAAHEELVSSVLRHLQFGGSARVLDAGCGTGNFLAAMIKHVPNVSAEGRDSSISMLRLAHRKVPYALLAECNLNMAIPDADQVFDAVICINVLYIIKQPAALVAELMRVTQPRGRVIIVTPKQRPNLAAFLAHHRQERGWLSLLKLIPPLVLVGLFNAIIVLRGQASSYTFFTEDELKRLTGCETLESVYADQCWLAVIERR